MTEEKQKQLEGFLKENDVLIVDKSGSTKRSLIKVLVDLGAETRRIHSVTHYDEAMEVFEEKRPQLVISDYYIGGSSGFVFFQDIRKKYPEMKKLVLTLITSNASQTVVAKAAEEDVDSYILKPYNVDTLQRILSVAILEKNFPSDYLKYIQSGKEYLFDGKFEEAKNEFEAAISCTKKPSLALFYHGQAMFFLNETEQAEKDYNKGLSYNKIHFKCLLGLYNLYNELSRTNDAYSVAKNITRYFPSNQERLCNVIRLCVETSSFEDMEEFYLIYKEIEVREGVLTNYLNAGLFVTAKHFIAEQELERALEHFQWLTTVSQRASKYLRAIIIELYKIGEFEEARKFLKKFDVDDMKSDDYKIAAFYAEFDQLNDNMRVQSGLEIFRSESRTPECFQILIDSLKEQKMDDKVVRLLEEARDFWPDNKFAA